MWLAAALDAHYSASMSRYGRTSHRFFQPRFSWARVLPCQTPSFCQLDFCCFHPLHDRGWSRCRGAMGRVARWRRVTCTRRCASLRVAEASNVKTLDSGAALRHGVPPAQDGYRLWQQRSQRRRRRCEARVCLRAKGGRRMAHQWQRLSGIGTRHM